MRCAVTSGTEMPRGLQSPSINLFFLRSVKNGAKTRVNILCTYRQHPSSPGLLAKQVFHELSRQTRGITRLGPYSLDKDSLYLNGELFSTHLTASASPSLETFPLTTGQFSSGNLGTDSGVNLNSTLTPILPQSFCKAVLDHTYFTDVEMEALKD